MFYALADWGEDRTLALVYGIFSLGSFAEVTESNFKLYPPPEISSILTTPHFPSSFSFSTYLPQYTCNWPQTWIHSADNIQFEMPRHVLQPLPRAFAAHNDPAARRQALNGDEDWKRMDRVQVLGGTDYGHDG